MANAAKIVSIIGTVLLVVGIVVGIGMLVLFVMIGVSASTVDASAALL